MFTCLKSATETLEKSERCSELTIKTTERYHWRCSGVFIVNFEHISHFVLVLPLLISNKQLFWEANVVNWKTC